jgi:hypothetical protein
VKKTLLVFLLAGFAFMLFGQQTINFTPSSNISAYTYEGIRSGVEKLKR